MLYFPKRVRFEVLILAALLVGGCDGVGLSEKQRAEVTDIAEDQADALVSTRTSDLESRIADIESRLNM